MAADLDLGVDVIAMPTVREHDGLAMSSRNRRLSPVERAAAVCIWRGLQALRAAVEAGEHDVDRLIKVAVQPIDQEPLARLEYLELVDPDDFQPAHAVGSAPVLAVAAVWIGDVRLIDNILLG
jgi:pantoate--beta-alanine ligase